MNSQLLYILILASVAGLILFRLYTVLGRRTGNERPPPERFESAAGISAPAKEPARLADRSAGVEQSAIAADSLQRGLRDIGLADRSFEPEHFLAGAKRAYEIIVLAFARADRGTLRPLLSSEVYSAFDLVIKGRETRSETVEFTFVGFGDVKITEASLSSHIASLTVTFPVQYISATRDSGGNVVQGDGKTVRSVTDIWSFERNTQDRDPNWRLVATSGEAELQED